MNMSDVAWRRIFESPLNFPGVEMLVVARFEGASLAYS